MRPLYLKMTAFGPYREQETIDFSELDPHTLFVIAGPTGAGKTSIFDALSFALFGTGSGEDRQDTRMLRSDFAPDDLHTAVELTFEVRGKVIRIFRQMAHVKAGNKTATGEKYELVEQTGEGDIPLVERYTVREINTKLMELVGMTADQFHQIVMLPQGEFRKFLTSSTDQKEVILRKLFRTERFQKMNDFLKERRQQLLDSSQQHRAVLAMLVNQAAGLYPEQETFRQAEPNLYQIDAAFGAGLETAQTEYRQSIEQEQQAWSLFQSEQKLLQQLEWMVAKRTRLAVLIEKQEKLVRQRPLIEQVRTRLEAAQRAQQIHHVYEARQKAVQQVASKSEQVADLEKRLNQTTEAFQQTDKEYQTAKGQEEARHELRREVDQLQQRIAQLEERQQLVLQERRLATTHHQQRTEVEQLELQLQQIDERLQYLVDQYQLLQGESKVIPEETTKLAKIKEQLQQVEQYENQKKQLEKLGADLLEATRQKQLAADAWQEVQQQQANELALQLVTHLHDGRPCPVCGATEHPAPAVSTDHSSHDSQATVEKQLQEATARQLRLTIEQERLQQDLRSFEEGHADVLKQSADLQGQFDRQQQLIEELNQKRKQADACMAEGRPLRAQQKQLKEQLPEKQRKLASLSEEWQRLIGQLQALGDQTDENALDKAKRHLADKQQQVQQVMQEWQQLQERYSQLKDAFQLLQQQTEWERKQLQELTTEQQRATTAWQQALSEYEFSQEDAFKQAVVPKHELARFKQDVEEYDRQVQQVTTERTILEHELEGHQEEVPLEEQQQKVTAAKAAWDELKDLSQSLQSKIQATERLVAQLTVLKEKMGDTEAKLATATALYDALRGQNNKKLSFERYMLIAYLEQITEAANQRLETLSGGQFRLVRSDRQESHGKQSGLQLDVYDGYTGQFRDVKSLSGGEKFHASLSLALGMADVMQEMNGGIQIDTMFIDEGFGSLDEESLQKAIEALVQLQRTGRLIGVISHVKELQAAIPAQLRVKKSASGTSSTYFQIG
ncbi:hypothetical protein CQS04_04630 [Chryseomicrobium excrementi]|uniref:Nuclease SbcCD subunit C n=1 Tax=Chryseomicrobium excrementi TaxID=2041346 RepID=A0A2M9EZ28_9BACL|nr:SMC family ATPase [Chryseomicrobium excrementi]PJK16446.1 hypothetical protein CQS04_04630 [Chryseomicrobium excrementi]